MIYRGGNDSQRVKIRGGSPARCFEDTLQCAVWALAQELHVQEHGAWGVYAYRHLDLAYRKYHCEHAQQCIQYYPGLAIPPAQAMDDPP